MNGRMIGGRERGSGEVGQWQVKRGRRGALRGCRSLVGHCVARCVSARHQNPQKIIFKNGKNSAYFVYVAGRVSGEINEGPKDEKRAYSRGGKS